MKISAELFSIIDNIDNMQSLQEKLELATSTLASLPMVSSIHVICFARSISMQLQNHITVLPYYEAGHFPIEPTEIGKDHPLASSLVKDPEPGIALFFFPFADRHGQRTGGFLVKTDSPAKMIKENSLVLRLFGSKIMDLLEITSLKQKAAKGSLNLSPDAVADRPIGIMDYLNLPMYISDFAGRFIYANDVFLKHFAYDSIEHLNASGNFFMEPDLRDRELKRLKGEGWVHRFNIRIRTGKNKIHIVQDSATLNDDKITGVLFDITEFISINEELLSALTMQEELNDRLINSTMILQKTQLTAIRSLARLAEYRDRETGNHLQRICEFAGLLTREVHSRQPYEYEINEDYINDMYLSSMLHDIGKVGVPDSILLKNGSLEHMEWTMMHEHTRWGWNILTQADRELGEQSFLTLAATIALNHHEWYDGTGYPNRKSGEEIPLSGRIAALADVYDALTSERPYKTAWDHKKALKEIESLRGKHFDPVLVDIFMEIEGQIDNIRQTFSD
jgi:HD-GYP domain-containing protein (c-di-GMP phosphodiesterase class II)